MSCEVLCCDIMCITETLSTSSNGSIVEDLFRLLDQPAPLDSRLAGYFEKVAHHHSLNIISHICV